MIRLLEWFNQAATASFGLMLFPFRRLSPVWPLLFVAGLTALLMLWVYRRTSNQEALGNVRSRLRGHILALRLFRHDARVILSVQGAVLRDTGTYLRLSLAPLLVMVVPLLVVLSQLDLRFSARPLAPGESATVTVRVATGEASVAPTLVVSPGLLVETPAVRIPSRREVSWRIRVREAGDSWVGVRWEGREFRMRVAVGGRWGAVSRLRSSQVSDMLLNPGESPLVTPLPLHSMEVVYSELPVTVLGWDANWLVLYFAAVLLLSLMLKGPLGVEI